MRAVASVRLFLEMWLRQMEQLQRPAAAVEAWCSWARLRAGLAVQPCQSRSASLAASLLVGTACDVARVWFVAAAEVAVLVAFAAVAQVVAVGAVATLLAVV